LWPAHAFEHEFALRLVATAQGQQGGGLLERGNFRQHQRRLEKGAGAGDHRPYQHWRSGRSEHLGAELQVVGVLAAHPAHHADVPGLVALRAQADDFPDPHVGIGLGILGQRQAARTFVDDQPVFRYKGLMAGFVEWRVRQFQGDFRILALHFLVVRQDFRAWDGFAAQEVVDGADAGADIHPGAVLHAVEKPLGRDAPVLEHAPQQVLDAEILRAVGQQQRFWIDAGFQVLNLLVQ
jgi:hypothetical protein